ncbi:ATP-binding protein [Paraburkholderia sp. BL10I2N1]|uniref:ATP-binding protein n=1 Tax=Paraburkholderia sp. BL10I2N1 TaxID=1938796 RepID=UPI00105EC4E3|nr:ATP-binding protein [Paraburkholderia sp. BL10I2N1]TDN67238.1 hypothetical protein B0G77_0488 [Paraburkholderia sp. BL10I2N1]
MADWRFYGRRSTLDQLRGLLEQPRWFFCRIQGRRRIGKTTLLRELARDEEALVERLFYVQIPDSDQIDVASQFRRALQDSLSNTVQALANDVHDFASMARAIATMNRAGIIVVLDEFQYFTSPQLAAFNSFLQAEVDVLRESKSGGLFVLGSLQSEMSALLDDRAAPLYGRLTHSFRLDHWDFEDLLTVYSDHGLEDPYQWLLLWTYFEGVPKFYRDAYGQGLFDASSDQLRNELLVRLFLNEGSPLSEEADTSFLREMKGQLLSILHFVADHPGTGHNELVASMQSPADTGRSLGAQLKKLVDNYGVIDRRHPVFSDSGSRNARYYVTDNFLQAWIAVVRPARDAARMQPRERVLEKAKPRSETLEGFAFEKLVRQLHVECSRKGKGDFPITSIEVGFWNRARSIDRLIEIDVVALNSEDKRVRFGSCKRNAGAHDSGALAAFENHIAGFMSTVEGRKLTGWEVEKVLFSPTFSKKETPGLEKAGYRCLDLNAYAQLF